MRNVAALIVEEHVAPSMNAQVRKRRLASAEVAFVIVAALLLLFTPLLDPAMSTTLALVLLVAAGLAWGVLKRPLRL